jgi:hypothetical protein
MSLRLLELLAPYFALIFMASATFRLARMRFVIPVTGLWALPKGPSAVMAVVELMAALFLMVPITLIWGLILGTALLASHMAALWKTRSSAPVQT